MEKRSERKEPVRRVSLKLQIDSLKGSVNRILIPSKNNPKKWIYGGGYRKQKEKMVQELRLNYADLKDHFSGFDTGHWALFEIMFVDRWLTKSSNYTKFRKKDVTNYVKNIEDVVSTFLGFDDSMVAVTMLNKVHIVPTSDEKSSLLITVELYEM
jgi:Holliday junction resolvase RusA-like endonuclease